MNQMIHSVHYNEIHDSMLAGPDYALLATRNQCL